MPRCSLPAVLLLLAVGSLAAGEPPARMPLPGESAGTGRRLDAADRLAADKQYASAAEEYARISDEAGDDLVAVGDHPVLPARRLCQLRLASLPPEALRSYRTRVDPQAKKWLEQGTANRDVRLLQRIVDEAFCSRPTEAALELLGDLAFEQGRFYEAGRWWRMLARPASERDKGQRTKDKNGPATFELVYPDPQTDVAQARAKQVLAMLFRGEVEAARTELDSFRALHPKAEGHLAGRKGNYADLLQTLASRPIPEAPAEDAWPTFGGASSRGAVLSAERSDPNRLNALVTDGPAWRFALGDLRRPAAAKAQHLAFHPVISGRHVFVADARTVTAIDTATGDKLTWDLGRDGGRRLNAVNGLVLNTILPAPPDLRYTMTVGDGRIYARLGVQGLPPAKQGAEADSFLICLKLADGGRKLTAAWLREAEPAGKGARAVFEGAPVVADGLLHVAATRCEGGTQMITEVRCYSTDSDAGPRWRQDVFSTRDVPTTPRYRHQLLTRAGRCVVYASHAGAVIALDARTGRRAWAFRYPGAQVLTAGGNPVLRDLAPPLYANGRLYVAPADYDRLLCLDPETGQLLWERERVDVVHLLGVGHGRLIFTTPKGIRAVRADNGDDNGGWVMPEPIGTRGLPSFGRGFLAGEYVFWPTTSGVKVLSQDDGQVPIDLIPGPLEVRGRLSPGNMAYAGGILAVADQSELRIYLPPGRGRREPLDKPGATPAQPLNGLARRAAELEKAGRSGEAVATWQRILDDDTLRRGTLRDSRHLPQRAAMIADEEIAKLLRAHGRDLYAPMEEKAGALLKSAKGDIAALERIVTVYPNAKAAESALRRLAEIYERSSRWGAVDFTEERLQRWGGVKTGSLEDFMAHKIQILTGQKVGIFPRERTDILKPLVRSWDRDERIVPNDNYPDRRRDLLLVRDPPESSRPRAESCFLVSRDILNGTERWSRPVVGAPTWAQASGTIAVAAGPNTVEAFARSDGTPLWHFLAPDSAAFIDPRLSAFQIVGDRVFCLQGESRLLTLDGRTGRVLWQSWSPAARLGADLPGARFCPHYLATWDRVLIQTEGGCRLLNAEDGSVVRDLPTEPILWQHPPLLVMPNLAVVVKGRHLVTAIDMLTGKVVWEYRLLGSSTLSGELPLLFGNWVVGLFVVVPRNAGYTLQQLNSANGRAMWADEVALELDHLDPSCIAFDRTGVYYTSHNVVTALDSENGFLLWKEPLPGPSGSWGLMRTAQNLAAWPTEARRTKFHSRWLTAALELEATFPPEDRPGRGIPVLLLAPANGEKVPGDRVMQRLNFEPPVPRAQGRLAKGEELTAVPRAFAERAAADGPVVIETGNGLVIGWGGKTWALRQDK